MQKVLSSAFIALLFVFIGCSKNDNLTAPTMQSDGTALTIPTFAGANTSSTDANATGTKTHAASMNGLMAQAKIFSIIPAQQNGNTFTWKYDVPGESYTFIEIKQGNGSSNWTLTFTGTSGSKSYKDYKLWEGTTSADGKNGSWTFYDFDQTGKAAELIYTIDAGNVLTGTWNIYDASGTLISKMVVVNNPDGSGRVEDYVGTIIIYKAVWIANGSGTWYEYTLGVQTSTGSWQ